MRLKHEWGEYAFPVDAEEAQAELERIRKEHGRLDASIVWEHVKSHKKSVLRPCFEWDKDAAWEAHNIRIAGKIFKSFRVLESDSGEYVPVYYSVPAQQGENYREYLHATQITTADIVSQIVGDIVGRIKSAKKSLSDFEKIKSVASSKQLRMHLEKAEALAGKL